MNRRQFLQLSTASAFLAGCDSLWLPALPPWLKVSLHKPAMCEGHYLRQLKQLPLSSGEKKVDTVIIGSGIAGLSAAWRLQQHGYKNFVLLMGAEPFGNANAGQWQDVPYPRGGHYLPLPTLESAHIREMLSAWGIIKHDAFGLQPQYDERALVHALDERVLIKQQWHEGLIAQLTADSQAQHQTFFALMQQLKQQCGTDGKPLFAIPRVLSSQDSQWLALDTLSFATWLSQQGFNDAALRWYLDYACKDDYGLDSRKISAWAGLHYFASRQGLAANAEADSVLTWPEGLAHLADKMLPPAAQRLQGFALNIKQQAQGIDVLYTPALGAKAFTLKAKKVICATPLHVTKYLVPHLHDYGFDSQQHLPTHAPWLVSNVFLEQFPQELAGAALAWDNVRYGSQSLGYVVATHQWLRAAKPQYTVFSAYHAFNPDHEKAGLEYLQQATNRQLLELAMRDLQQAYGQQLWRCVHGVELTLRAHAMAAPTVGFLHNRGLNALQAVDGQLLFAHSDLSGLSLFEEAAWWGWQAAAKLLT